MMPFSRKNYMSWKFLHPQILKKKLFFSKTYLKKCSAYLQRHSMTSTLILEHEEFWSKIAALGERYSKDEHIRKMNGNRGSKHFLYMNRTFFGLFNSYTILRRMLR